MSAMKPEIDVIQRWFGYDPNTGFLIRKLKLKDSLPDTIKPSTDKRVYFMGKRYPYTHIVWVVYHGYWPTKEIDHIDHDILNNKILNLREITTSENIWNRRSWNVNGKGVTFDGSTFRNKPWVVRISKHGKSTFIGSYATKEEAAIAYQKAATEHHGEFACHD